MSRFLETIKIEDGELQHPDLHLQRIQDTCMEYYGEKKNLNDILGHFELYAKNSKEKTKLTISYDLKNHFFSSMVYSIRKIETLFMVENNELDYHLKYADRKTFDEYTRNAGFENEVIIIQNNRITDGTFANLAFWNGNEWHTPLLPLLKGTKRNFLLQNKQLKEHDIFVADLKLYQKVSLINAMLELGECLIDTDRIMLLSDL